MPFDRDPSEMSEAELIDELQALERVELNEQPAPGIDPDARRGRLLDEVFERLAELERLREQADS